MYVLRQPLLWYSKTIGCEMDLQMKDEVVVREWGAGRLGKAEHVILILLCSLMSRYLTLGPRFVFTARYLLIRGSQSVNIQMRQKILRL